MLGLTRDDLDDTAVEMWPDTERSIHLFIDLATQWRVGMSGATGLDYAAIPPVLDMRGIPAPERGALFDDLRLMEIETLNLQAKENS